MARVVVLVIDGLGARHVGPYGNTWIETPAFNQLGAQSLLLQNMASQPSMSAAYRELWGPTRTDGDWPSRLHARGVTTRLMTDDASVTDLASAGAFQEQTELPVAREDALAEEWSATHLAQFFAHAFELVTDLPSNSLTWLHTAGLGSPWDAPYAFRARYADEEDPEPSVSAQVPSLNLEEGYDPDTLHDIRCAMAGQVTLLDRCLHGLLAAVTEHALDQNTLLVVTSLRGFPLGEHGVVGWPVSRLYSELVHVPCFLRFPGQQQAMQRWMGLTEIGDLPPLIEHWLSNEELNEINRAYSIRQNERELLLRTPVWFVRFPDVETSNRAGAQLFFKPDDQNEVNDVSDRCEQVVTAAWELVQRWIERPDSELELPDLLMQPFE